MDTKKTVLFLYKINVLKKESYSKRVVLSLISGIFDQYGFLRLVITNAKIFLHRFYSATLRWDDPLPDTIAKDWMSFIPSLIELKNLHIPRFAFYEPLIILHV